MWFFGITFSPRWPIAVSLALFPATGHAQSNTDYEKLILRLEQRIERLEGLIVRQDDQVGIEKMKQDLQASPDNQVVDSSLPVTGEPPQDIALSDESEIPVTQSANWNNATQDEGGAIESQEDRDVLATLAVIRDKAVGLGQGNWELANDIDYLREDNSLQFARAVVGSTTLRYGLTDGIEIGVKVPGVYSHRKTNLFGGSQEEDLTYLGDISLQLNATVLRETGSAPGVVALLGATVPTGPSPYEAGEGVEAGRNPNSVFKFYTQTAGHYQLLGGLQVFKSFDPVVFFGGVSARYFFPDSFYGVSVEPAMMYSYNIGFGFAVSQSTTLGATVFGSHQQNLVVDSEKVLGPVSEPVSTRFSLSQRFNENFFVEPSVTLGLTNEAPDVIVSLGTRWRF